jgi:hypothetical protein
VGINARYLPETMENSLGLPGAGGPHEGGRTSLVLSASQIEFLERLCARFRRDSGARFTKALLLRVLVSVLAEAGLPAGEIRTETHLKEWLRAAGSAAPLSESPGRSR